MADTPLTIGAFSRATGLSVKALRSYDRLGLLSPARVDPDTRYRRYAHEQIGRGLAIRRLRELEVPLREIGRLVEADPAALREGLLTHQRRLALRATQVGVCAFAPPAIDRRKGEPDEGRRRRYGRRRDPSPAGGRAVNRSWRLLELERRTPEQDDELIHCAHASRHHWGEVGTAAQVARGENQCARAYAALGRAEPALHHANRCLDLVRAGGEGSEDWDLASALEMAARANLVAKNPSEAARYAELARQELETTADPDDREVIESQLAELGV